MMDLVRSWLRSLKLVKLEIHLHHDLQSETLLFLLFPKKILKSFPPFKMILPLLIWFVILKHVAEHSLRILEHTNLLKKYPLLLDNIDYTEISMIIQTPIIQKLLIPL